MNTKEATSSQDGHNQRGNPGTDLNEDERQEVEQRINVSAIVVHETVRLEGERELKRTLVALICSSFAAGLAMGLSLVMRRISSILALSVGLERWGYYCQHCLATL